MWMRTHVLAIGVLSTMAQLSSACWQQNLGEKPPDRSLYFPSGLLVDPRATSERPARWLFVANANSDLRYSGGTLVAIDLRAFFEAWEIPGSGTVDAKRILAPDSEFGSESNAGQCRRNAQRPAIVECDERHFVAHRVHIGDFSTVVRYSNEPHGLRLWVPVRGDPSITYIDVLEQEDSLQFECGAGENSGESDSLRCGADHRLMDRRNDPNSADSDRLDREPFNLLVSPDPNIRLAYVAHASSGELTLIALDGPTLGDRRPAIVDSFSLFSAENTLPGGFGLAQRPCFVAGANPADPNDGSSNVPSATLAGERACAHPLVYASHRYVRYVTSFTAVAPAIEEGTQKCVGPDELDVAGGVVCDEHVVPLRRFSSGGLDTFAGNSLPPPTLGAMAFGDARGDELYVVQTTPGALLRIDTSLDDSGRPRDVPSAPPVEICGEPSTLVVHDDGVERLAFVSCYQSAHVFIVDLPTFRVVEAVLAGTGPHDMAVDAAREFLYVANTLEASISVIDISRTRATRFSEVVRLGVPEPYSR